MQPVIKHTRTQNNNNKYGLMEEATYCIYILYIQPLDAQIKCSINTEKNTHTISLWLLITSSFSRLYNTKYVQYKFSFSELFSKLSISYLHSVTSREACDNLTTFYNFACNNFTRCHVADVNHDNYPHIHSVIARPVFLSIQYCFWLRHTGT